MLRHYPQLDGELHEVGRVIQFASKRLTLPIIEGVLLVAVCEVRRPKSREPWTTRVLWELCLRIHLNDKRYLPGEAVFWEENLERFTGAVREAVRNLETIESTTETPGFVKRFEQHTEVVVADGHARMRFTAHSGTRGIWVDFPPTAARLFLDELQTVPQRVQQMRTSLLTKASQEPV